MYFGKLFPTGRRIKIGEMKPRENEKRKRETREYTGREISAKIGRVGIRYKEERKRGK